MLDQYNDSLGVCNVKITKCLWGQKQGMSRRMYPINSIDFNFFHGIAGDRVSSCLEQVLTNMN